MIVTVEIEDGGIDFDYSLQGKTKSFKEELMC